MTYDEEIFASGAVVQELLEVLESGSGGQCGRMQDLRFVAGLGANQGGGLEAALEGAGDDEVELDVQSVKDMSELKTVLLAFFIKGALRVDYWIGTSQTGTGVSKDIQIHLLHFSAGVFLKGSGV
jgi:hypothetical protein